MTKQFNTPPFNSLQEKLEKVRRQTYHTGFRAPVKSKLPPVDSIGNDGKDHINIWEKASTELGVALSHMADLPFTHDTYGKFRSVEGFWHYIRSVSRDDRTRMMFGYKAKKFGDTLVPQRIDDFKAIIMDANWQKIKQYTPLVEEIKNTKLPFDVYYLFNDDNSVRIRLASSFWIIEGFEEIRKAINDNREPDFDFLKDPQNRNKKKVAPLPATEKARYVPAVLSSTLVKMANSRNNENNNNGNLLKPKENTPLIEDSVLRMINSDEQGGTVVEDNKTVD